MIKPKPKYIIQYAKGMIETIELEAAQNYVAMLWNSQEKFKDNKEATKQIDAAKHYLESDTSTEKIKWLKELIKSES